MHKLEPHSVFVEKLNAVGVPYMVSGSVAAIFYGEPRLTHDIDIILDIKDQHLSKLLEQFPDNEFYLPPIDVIRIENRKRTRGHFNIIHHETGHRADIYPIG